MKKIAYEKVISKSSDKNLRRSKDGYEFELNAETWDLGKDNKIKLDWPYKLAASLRTGAIKTLAFFAEEHSAAHTGSMFYRMGHFIKTLGITSINPHDLINYRSMLDKEHQWYLGTIRVFLKKWFELGYPGISKEVIELLTKWRLRGNEKGQAVLSIDPENGPFSDIELETIHDRLVEFYVSNKINVEDYALSLLIANTGRRPRQIGDLKVSDLYEAKNKDGISSYYINFPRRKLRGLMWRSHFKSFAISADLWISLMLHTSELEKRVKLLLKRELTQEEKNNFPLFPNCLIIELADHDNILERLKTDYFHQTTQDIALAINRTIESLSIISERTGNSLKVNPRRFRYTLGTRAAREGWGVSIIAELLDHSDIQNADVYVKNSPEHATEISKIMATALTPYAQAFAGTLVNSKNDAIRGEDSSSCIRMEDKALGNCGSFGFCSASAPIACYTCNKFQPWVEAPHEYILKWLVDDRKRAHELTGDVAIAAINDRTIMAVTQVIKLCKDRKEVLEKQNG